MSRPRCVPPAPHVIAGLFMEYVHKGKPFGLTFRQFLRAVGYSDPAADTDGMDDGAVMTMPPDMPPDMPSLVSVPQMPVRGSLRIIVLLADFPDAPGMRPAQEFEDLLFTDRIYPMGGSLRDYYREVSGGRVDVSGTVHGWFRLPQPLSFYAGTTSGLRGAYPRNARRMAEDAVAAALRAGVTFPRELDALGTGTVTGLFIVHAGSGGEALHPTIAGGAIWSHKWTLRTAAALGDGLMATTYLTVPEDCRMGVCAHELGHLAFQWEDFYDPNGGDDGVQWAGSGRWDLMAGGSWNGDMGDRPAHPMGLHKSQHGWIDVETVTTSGRVVVAPYTATGGKAVKVVSPAYTQTQFLLLENRVRNGFDDALPGEGLLVWRVDLDRAQTGPARPAVQLTQADGRQDLELNLNQGDHGDPFPGTLRTVMVGDTGLVSTSFPGGPRSGVTLSDITVDPLTGAVSLAVEISAPATTPAPTPAPGTAAQRVVPETSARGADRGPAGMPPRAGVAPAEPVRPLLAGLANLLRQPRISAAELAPLVREVTPTPMDLVRRVLAVESAMGTRRREQAGRAALALGDGDGPQALLGGFIDLSGFDGRLFRSYKANFGVEWDMRGRFLGTFDFASQLQPRGRGEYLYIPHATDPLRFERSTGELVQPGRMITDGGSVPRVASVIPDIDPFTYIKAYLIHDWDFLRHHCDTTYGRAFEVVNLTLGEGIYTLMRDGEVGTDWRKVELVYQAVSSFVGQGVWDRPWVTGECGIALPGGDPAGTT